MTISFQFDPYEVLGVGPSASLQEIRDAYRARSKVYHPDVGGNPWAFRVLARSYETLSEARVASRAREEVGRGSATSAEVAPRVEPTPAPAAHAATGRRGSSNT